MAGREWVGGRERLHHITPWNYRCISISPTSQTALQVKGIGAAWLLASVFCSQDVAGAPLGVPPWAVRDPQHGRAYWWWGSS